MKRILTNILYTVIALVLGLLLLVPSDETQEPQKNSEQLHSVTLMDKTAGQADVPGAVAKEENVPQKIAEQLNFPALTGRVVDQAGILSPSVKEEL